MEPLDESTPPLADESDDEPDASPAEDESIEPEEEESLVIVDEDESTPDGVDEDESTPDDDVPVAPADDDGPSVPLDDAAGAVDWPFVDELLEVEEEEPPMPLLEPAPPLLEPFAVLDPEDDPDESAPLDDEAPPELVDAEDDVFSLVELIAAVDSPPVDEEEDASLWTVDDSPSVNTL